MAALTIAVGKGGEDLPWGKGKGKAPKGEVPESEGSDVDLASAEDLLTAIKSGDAQAFLDAWRGMPCPEMMRSKPDGDGGEEAGEEY